MQQDSNKPAQQIAAAQIDDLLAEAKQIASDIDTTNKEINTKMDEHSTEVDESVSKLEKIFSNLNQIEEEAADELDKLILQQAENLAEE